MTKFEIRLEDGTWIKTLKHKEAVRRFIMTDGRSKADCTVLMITDSVCISFTFFDFLRCYDVIA